MLVIGNNQVTENIYKSDSSVIYRAHDFDTKKPIILKVLNTNRPSSEQLEKFTQEYTFLTSFSSDNIVRGYELEKYNNSLFIAMEDFNGIPLSQTIDTYKLKIGWFLELAIKLTTTLQTIHEQKIIHKDCTPANILYNNTTGQVKLIDFSISQHIATSSHLNLEGSLPYIAPEQTGRINQTIDFSTDLYTLGATLYHILTGTEPFQTSDPMEMVHFHIAKEPTPAHKTNTIIPITVSLIISKLMEKSMGNRYRSCAGLLADLQTCLKHIKSSSPLVPFELGQKDSIDKFFISDTLFGLENKTEIAREALSKTQKSKTSVLLISGEKGSGKTAFAESLKQLSLGKNSYFVSGNFFKGTLFGPITNVLQEYVKQLLTEDQSQLQQWKKNLSEELGDSAKVITDIFPDLKMLLGKQPALPVLSPSETVRRFTLSIRALIRTSTPLHTPLVLFFDDIHLADPPTLTLLKSIITDQTIKNLHIIVTYCTSAEKTIGTCPLYPLINQGIEITTIQLPPLSAEHTQQLLADSLKVPPETTYALAQVLLTKTRGVPFYIKQFLISLHRKGYITAQKNNISWKYRLEGISQENATENVIRDQVEQIAHLPENLLTTLQILSCIPETFSSSYAEILIGKDVSKQLNHATRLGILQESPQKDSTNRTVLRFSHPQIKTATYSTQTPQQKRSTHLLIGKQLLKQVDLKDLESGGALEIADQLNTAKEANSHTKDNLELSKINLQAGKVTSRAKKTKKSLEYFLRGSHLLPTNKWDKHFNLTLEIHLEVCKAAASCGELKLVKEMSKLVIQHSKTREPIIAVYTYHIQALKRANQLSNAITLGIEALNYLGVKIPEKPTKIQKLLTYLHTRILLFFKSEKDLDSVKVISNPEKLASTNFLLEISPIAYSTNPELLPFICNKAMIITLKQGNSLEATAATYALFGFIQCSSMHGNIKRGIKYGKLALQNHKKLEGTNATYFTPFIVINFLSHWETHISQSLERLKKIYNDCLKFKEIDGAISAANSISYRLLLIGTNMSDIAVELANYRRFLDKSGQQVLIYRQMIYQQFVDNLLGNNSNPTLLEGSFYSVKKFQHLHEEEHDQTTLFQLNISKIALCFIFKQYKEALKHCAQAEVYKSGSAGSILLPQLYFYDSLVRISLYKDQSNTLQKIFLRKIEKNQKMMKKWAKCAPMNFLHKYYLVEAEKIRILNKNQTPLDLYDKALDLAKKNQYPQDVARINDYLADYYQEVGKNHLAQSYAQEARYCYFQLGIKSKTQHIDKTLQQTLPSHKDSTHENSLLENNTLPKNRLDMMAVIKASRTLTGEIVLEELLKKMLQIMIENAGAQKGFILFKEDKEWFVRASGSIILVDASIKITSGPLSEHKNDLSEAIINYVARTSEIVVLNDATNKGLFTQDKYILAKKPKSVLCAPIIHQGQISCILYLENNLSTKAFPPERQETLNILGTQAAISLKNSTLYSDLGSTVKQLHKEIQKRKDTQNQLLHAEKLTALGRLSASIAHEFGNPLMGIRYLLEDFHNRLKLQKEDQDLIKIGLDECNRMKNLMNELHQLDKPSTGKVRTFDIHISIENILSFQRKLFTTKNVKINRKFDGSTMNIVAVEDQITQVLINLFLNAADAIPATTGGVITISTGKNDRWVHISIHDTGVGIKSEHQEKIFEPFFSTKPEVEGTGLGLPTSYGIIKGHGGDIICTSLPGQGTTFTVKIPTNSIM